LKALSTTDVFYKKVRDTCSFFKKILNFLKSLSSPPTRGGVFPLPHINRRREPLFDPKISAAITRRAMCIPYRSYDELAEIGYASEAVRWGLEPIEIFDDPTAVFAVAKYWRGMAKEAALLIQEKPLFWKLRLWLLTKIGFVL
jgi:hypothetical protein